MKIEFKIIETHKGMFKLTGFGIKFVGGSHYSLTNDPSFQQFNLWLSDISNQERYKKIGYVEY